MIYEMPKDRVFITPNMMRLRYGTYDPNVFKRWQDKGWVRKLRNGLYLDESFEIRSEVDEFIVANHLYEPSYISLHAALHYHSLIPEHVVEVMSITTRKTKIFECGDIQFSYAHVKPDLFFGFEEIPWRGMTYRIAKPEKALLDLAYLEPLFSDKDWIEEMRFDTYGIMEEINWELMFAYADAYESQVTKNRITLLLGVCDPCWNYQK